MATTLSVWITLDVDGAQPTEIKLAPVRVCREVVPAGIHYTVVALDAEIPADPAMVRSIKIDDGDDGHATWMRKSGLEWTEIEFLCQATRPMLDALARA